MNSGKIERWPPRDVTGSHKVKKGWQCNPKVFTWMSERRKQRREGRACL